MCDDAHAPRIGRRTCLTRRHVEIRRGGREGESDEHSTGNEMTPSSKYDFKFKDYAPWVFRSLREHFHVEPSDYLVTLR